MWYMTTLSFEEESKAQTFGIGIVLILGTMLASHSP